MNEVNEYQASKAKRDSIIRYTGLTLVILNAILTMFDMPIIPEEAADTISAGLLVVVGLYVGFKNNYLTKRGKKQAEVLAARDLLNK